MNLRLKGKRALITGSTAGIGFAAAVGLAREGVSVIVNGRSAERVQAAVERLRNESGTTAADVSGVAADLSSAEGADSLIGQVPDVDILVNNMGIFEPKPFEEIADADWLRFFETNVMSGVRLTRHYLPGMKERDWGRIVFVSSESAVQIPSEMIHYGMTKTAQLAIGAVWPRPRRAPGSPSTRFSRVPPSPRAWGRSSPNWPGSRASAATSSRRNSSGRHAPHRC